MRCPSLKTKDPTYKRSYNLLVATEGETPNPASCCFQQVKLETLQNHWPVDFILHAFLKSSWNPSGTTDPRQTRQTPGFHLARLVAIKLEPFLNHCSRNAPGEKKAAQGSKKQCRIPAKDLTTFSDLWISYCVFSSNQVGAPPETLIYDKHLRQRRRQLKAAKQCRIPARELGTSDLWISYCVLSSNQVGTPPEH